MPNAADIAAITGLVTAVTALIAAISGILNHRKITHAQKTATSIQTTTDQMGPQMAEVHDSLQDTIPGIVKLINGKNGGTEDAGNHHG